MAEKATELLNAEVDIFLSTGPGFVLKGREDRDHAKPPAGRTPIEFEGAGTPSPIYIRTGLTGTGSGVKNAEEVNKTLPPGITVNHISAKSDPGSVKTGCETNGFFDNYVKSIEFERFN